MLNGNLGEKNNITRGDNSSSLEAWDAPQLVPLDLGSAQAVYCMFGGETAPDNGPKVVGCS